MINYMKLPVLRQNIFWIIMILCWCILDLSPYLEEYYRKSWEATIIDSFLWSPILCRYLEDNRTWFSQELYALYEKAQIKKQLAK